MRLRTIFLSCILLGTQSTGFSESTTSSDESTGILRHFSLGVLGSYTDFKFNSTAGVNYNRYNGHSKLYAINAGNMQLTDDLLLGVSAYKASTKANTELYLSPYVQINGTQHTNNETIFAHVLKKIKPYFFVDLAGAFGHNNGYNVSELVPFNPNIPIPNTPTLSSITSYNNTNYNNWFVSGTGLFAVPWKSLIFIANGRLLYSQINAGSSQSSYAILLPPTTNSTSPTEGLFLIENIEVGYNKNPEIIPFTLFLNAGLVQVLKTSQVNTQLNIPINGVSPELLLNQNGYRLGGGISYQYQDFSIRLEEQYYNASNLYRSYQTLLGVRQLI